MRLCLIHVFVLCSSVLGGTIPFDPSRGLVEVEVKINGRVKGVFGIDIGADRLYIDKVFARENNLALRRAAAQRDIVGIDGKSKPSAISLRSLQIGGGETLYNLRATGVDMRALVKDTTGGVPDGLIGQEILRRFYVTVDYPHRSLELLSTEPDFLRGKKYHEVRFKHYQHLILVDVVFNDEITVPMILDYCASYTTISRSLASRLGFDPDSGRLRRVSKMRLGDRVVSTDVPVLVSDFSAFRRSVPRAKFEGILGASFLYQHKITVDYKRKKIYVHKR